MRRLSTPSVAAKTIAETFSTDDVDDGLAFVPVHRGFDQKHVRHALNHLVKALVVEKGLRRVVVICTSTRRALAAHNRFKLDILPSDWVVGKGSKTVTVATPPGGEERHITFISPALDSLRGMTADAIVLAVDSNAVKSPELYTATRDVILPLCRMKPVKLFAIVGRMMDGDEEEDEEDKHRERYVVTVLKSMGTTVLEFTTGC